MFSYIQLPEIIGLLGVFFIHGGWIIFVIALIVIFYYTYKLEIQHQFIHNTKWIFWEIKVPRENLVSTLAIESVYSQIHAIHQALTFAEMYVEGRVQLWLSLEIVSMGGKISYVIRAPEAFKDLVQSAFYSQYPTMEITEIHDYMENIQYDPETSDFDIWGVEWKLVEDEAIPIKTYKDFEHPNAEEKIIDPLNNLLEPLAKIEPHEFFGVQVIIQPLADEEWKLHGDLKVKELTGEEVEHKPKLSDLFFAPLNWVANFSFLSLLSGGGHEEKERNQKNDWMSMTDQEKERVNLIQKKIGKPGYKTKIRNLYIAPKNKFDKMKRYMVIGFYRTLGSAMTNKLKPDGKIWTSIPYQVSPTLEAPYINYETNRRKRHLFKGYKNRDIHIGRKMYVLNIEELATLYHFPITTTPASGVVTSRVASTKAQPPIDLPIGEAE